MSETCTRVNCGKEATLRLRVSIDRFSGPPILMDYEYCDADFAWFYRRFATMGNGIHVADIEVLVTPHQEVLDTAQGDVLD